MERTESPVTKVCVEKNIENKVQRSPGIPKGNSSARQADSAGRYVRDSPNNFRRNPEFRRESPRYAEPVRKGSRDSHAKRGIETGDERKKNIENKAKRLLNGNFLNNGDPLIGTIASRPIFRKRDYDGRNFNKEDDEGIIKTGDGGKEEGLDQREEKEN
jgi:hypothetical protein